jgi:hypothetical protein
MKKNRSLQIKQQEFAKSHFSQGLQTTFATGIWA